MPTKKGAELRPGDLVVLPPIPDPVELGEVIWTWSGLCCTTPTSSTEHRLDPDGDYQLASPMPHVSMRWNAEREAWVVAVGTDPCAAQEARVVVVVDGNELNDPV